MAYKHQNMKSTHITTRISATVTKIPEKLQLTYLSISEQTEAMKKEIRDKIASLRDKLNSLECDLLAKVDNLAAEQENARKELEESLASMNAVKASLLATKCSEDIKLSIGTVVKELHCKITQCSQKLLHYTKIESTWDTDYWDSSDYSGDTFCKLCKLTNVTVTGSVYQSKSIPKWQICNGSSPSQLESPVSLAIQDETDNIFVSDMEGMRIQVFSPEGEHKRLINAMDGPFQVFSVDTTYLYAFDTKQILEFELESMDTASQTYDCRNSSGKVVSCGSGFGFSGFYSFSSSLWGTKSKVCSPFLNYFSVSSSPSTSKVTASAYSSRATNTDLKKEKSISLRITPKDIAYYNGSIFLLVSGSKDLVYEYNNNCVFIRSFFPCPESYEPLAMCIDREGNIIIAGNKVETAEVVSSRKSISKSGSGESSDENDDQPSVTKLFVLTQKGEFIIQEMNVSCEDCIGVAVNSNFDILLLTNDNKNILTAI